MVYSEQRELLRRERNESYNQGSNTGFFIGLFSGLFLGSVISIAAYRYINGTPEMNYSKGYNHGLSSLVETE